MKARISQTPMAYHVELSAARDSFAQLLDSFKSTVPKCNRRFMPDRHVWFVDLRAKKRVEQFASAVTDAGGQVKSDGLYP